MSLKNSFQEFNVEEGYFWQVLRQCRFFNNDALMKVQDQIF